MASDGVEGNSIGGGPEIYRGEKARGAWHKTNTH